MPDALAQGVAAGAYHKDLSSLSALPEQLSAEHGRFINKQSSADLTDLDVTVAFDAWRNLVADPNTTPTSPVSLHLLRGALMTVAPSLITRDENDLPAKALSPAEAVYFFDFLIAHGAIPPLSRTAALSNSTAYRTAVATYMVNTPETKRLADLTAIIHKYLLKNAD